MPKSTPTPTADDCAKGAVSRQAAKDPVGPLNIGEVSRLTREDRERHIWRRISGMTYAIEPFMDEKERRAGIKRLVEWIEDRVVTDLKTREEAAKEDRSADLQVRMKQGEASSSVADPVAQPGQSAIRNPKSETALSCVTPWLPQLDGWARVAHAATSPHSICAHLGVTHAKLSRLVGEYCGMTIEEFVDGLKLRRLQRELINQLKTAAKSLWGKPGELADRQCLNEDHDGITLPEEKMNWRQIQEWRRDSNRRGAQLVETLHALRKIDPEPNFFHPGRGEEEPMDLLFLAQKLGFESVSRLKRAIMNVFGTTLEKIELRLSKEIAYFYAAAEEKVLREVASMKGNTHFITQGRYLYSGDFHAPAPTAPFLDMWSCVEELQPSWTKKMSDEFMPPELT